MKSYQIWLKGGGDLSGTMSVEDSNRLERLFDEGTGRMTFVDGDGDTVRLDVGEIAVFACRDETKQEQGIGFRNGGEVA